MPNPAEDVNRVVRTVIEAADPALRPVVRLRRFVVKRVELVGAALADPAGLRPDKPGAGRGPGQKRTGAAPPRK